MKYSRVILLIAICLLSLAGCSSSGQPNSYEQNALQQKEEIVNLKENSNVLEHETSELTLQENKDNTLMVERSLVSTGNNYRMKKVIEQSQDGQATTIAYIGGSITEGFNGGAENNYAKQSFHYFANTFGTGNNVQYVNAGMAGTPSSIGLIRLERDVLQYEPDVVFVEFAVNDSNDGQSMAAFESLLRQLWNSNKEPAIVLIFTLTEDGYSAQNEMENIGRYYDLPMISVKNAISPELQEGTMSWSEYSDDTVHPDQNGHALITSFIEHYYEAVGNEEKDSKPVAPESTYYRKTFDNMMLMDAEHIQTAALGSFVEDSTIKQFPKGWTHFPDTGNNSFMLDLTFSSLFIVTKESNSINTGTIEILIDGQIVQVINGYNSSGWNNPVHKLLLQDDQIEDHKVEIRMAEGSEDKVFSILAFGVVK